MLLLFSHCEVTSFHLLTLYSLEGRLHTTNISLSGSIYKKNSAFSSLQDGCLFSHLFIYSITYCYYYTLTDIYHQCNVILLLKLYQLWQLGVHWVDSYVSLTYLLTPSINIVSLHCFLYTGRSLAVFGDHLTLSCLYIPWLSSTISHSLGFKHQNQTLVNNSNICGHFLIFITHFYKLLVVKSSIWLVTDYFSKANNLIALKITLKMYTLILPCYV